jgi:alpha-tubulin suppressor-like RCC1 family protein
MKRLIYTLLVSVLSVSSVVLAPALAVEVSPVKEPAPSLDAGWRHVCALNEESKVVCWGNNASGQTAVPENLGLVTQVSAGGEHTCAITATGFAKCWGLNTGGQSSVPQDLGRVSQISAGYDNTCAVTETGQARCWGLNSYGSSTVPQDLGKVVEISTSGFITCSLKETGEVVCWGYKARNGENNVPVDLAKSARVSTRGNHACALSEERDLRCWGSYPFSEIPLPLNMPNVKKVSTGAQHTCMIGEDDHAKCWGWNQYGRAVVPQDLGTVSEISAGVSFTCAVTEYAQVRCWGDNSEGELNVPNDLVVHTDFHTATQPLISGDPKVGAIISASTGTWDEGTEFSYQWLRDGVEISGSVASSYQIKDQDFGKHISLRLRAKKDEYRFLSRNSESLLVNQNQFSSISIPTISGEAKVGSTLTTSVGNWDEGTSFSYQWLRNGAEIPGADQNTYLVQEQDFGTQISIRLSAEKGSYLPLQRTSATKQVLASEFITTSIPTINGTPTAGSTLMASVGNWDEGITFSYQWLRDGVDISAATSNTYQVTDDDAGKKISVRVLAQKTFYNSATKSSAALTIPLPILSQSSVAVGTEKLSAGPEGTCAILTNGSVFCTSSSTRAGNVPSNLGKVSSISLGKNTACAIKTDKSVVCWGENKAILRVPTNLGKVVYVGVGEGHACALNTTGVVHCWGLSPYLQTNVPKKLMKVTQLSVGENHTCAVTIEAMVSCWGVNEYGESPSIPNAYFIDQVSSGGGHTCAISILGVPSCWGDHSLGQSTIPFGLGVVTQISAGAKHTCAVTEAGFARCWGDNSFGQSSVPSGIGKVTQISAGTNHTCAVAKLGKLICWGDDYFGQLAQSSIAPPQVPEAPSNFQSISTEGNSLFLTFNQNKQASDDLVIWKVIETRSKKTVCLTGKAGACWVDNLTPGATYQFSLTGTNDAGSTKPVVIPAKMFCPPNPSISANVPSSVVVNGSTIKTTGTLTDMCFNPKEVSYRQKVTGKPWSAWKNYPVSASHTFSVTNKYNGNTLVQFKVQDGKKTYQTEQLPINMRIRFALPISVYWKAAKTPQGFTQGGTITIKFGGDREFSGSCTVLAETADAYNFASIWVGSESHYTVFNVRNGAGSGNINMRWNGRATVGAICSDPKFSEISEYRYVTFSPNY